MNTNTNSWTKERVFQELKGRTKFRSNDCMVETVEGSDSSIIISMCAVGDKPISVTMNGKEMLAEVVMFSLAKEERASLEKLDH